MNLEQKKSEVTEIQNGFAAAKSAILVDYAKVKCAELVSLRRKLEPVGGEFRVVKNTLAKRALSNVGISALDDKLKGQTAVIWSKSDPVSSAKIVSEFQKTNETFIVKAGLLDGKVLTPANVKDLASMPSKEELLSKLLSLINAPATRLLQTINAPASNFVRLLSAVKDKKGNAA